ncbi:MAG TPA: CHAT domain-containing tetratricopeptide repeat protein [Blastocatellia bacterium]|nr:CHAT domain-containing tetratricopeptide repeat protein [Blastocatellia bacterium]
MPFQNLRLGRTLTALFILTAALCAAASGQDATPLLPGSPVERELSGGQTHVYLLRLEAGQFLDLVVDQRGIDVEVLLTGPDGKLLEQVDSPNGARGPEPLKLIAEQAGVYRLEIRALDKDAKPGRYEAKINELRAGQTSDRDVIRDFRIGQLFSGAAALTSQGTGAALRQSIELLEKAASLLRQTNNRQQLANALLGIGQRYTRLGDAQKGVEYYRQALPLYAESGNRNGQAVTLNSLGLAFGMLGQIQQAEEAYEQSLQLRRESGDRKALGVGLLNLGDFYSRKGEPQRAIDYFTEALQTGRELKDDDMTAYASNNLGVNYAVIGDKQRAREYLSEAVQIFRRTGDRRMEVAALTSLSRVVAGEDRPQQFETLKQALKVYRELGEQRGEAGALNNLGQVAAEMGNRDEALDYFNQSLALMQKMHNTQGEATVYLSLGRFSFDRGDLAQSLDYFNQSLTLQRELQNPAGEARALLGIARAERARGNLGEARKSIEQAITIIEELRTRLAGQEQRSAYLASVQDYYELYVDLLMQQQRTSRRDSVKGEDYVALALEASERTRARSLRELLLEARFDIRQGADPELLRQEKRLQQELNNQLERQMQLLSNPHNPAQAAAVKKATADIRRRLQDVETQIRRQSPRYAALTQPQPLTLAEIQQVLPDSETLLLEYLLGRERSYLWVVGPQSLKSYELPGRERIEASARRVLDLLTARNQSDANESAAQRRARIARADAQYWQAAANLSRMILRPAARQLSRKRLLIVADGPLQYVPFAALPEPAALSRPLSVATKQARGNGQRTTDNRQPLIIRHEIISLPSASVLVEARRAPARQPPGKTIAVLADPVFEANDERITTIKIAAAEKRPATQPEQTRVLQQRPGEIQVSRLPFTRAEADRILKLVPAEASLRALDFRASRATAMSEQLGEYRIVHFATHGYFDAENPELSRLLFSRFDETGRPQQWALSAPEVFNLKLSADLVVLSGCRTALGKAARGEGIGVLTRGFLYAGAARVLASLWNVSDQGTAELMGRFYEGLLGPQHERPGAALRTAQLSLLRRPHWQSPYYWAAFVLQGEW